MNGKAATCPRSKRKLTYNPADLIFSHGTSSVFFPTIRRSGIQPRGEREQKSVFKGSLQSAPDLTYLGLASYNRENGKWHPNMLSTVAAERAASIYGGDPVILYVRLRPGDAKNLTMDEDASTWLCWNTEQEANQKRLPKIEDLTEEQHRKLAWAGELYYDQKQEKMVMRSANAIRDELPSGAFTREERKQCEREADEKLRKNKDSVEAGRFIQSCRYKIADDLCNLTSGTYNEETHHWEGSDRSEYLDKPTSYEDRDFCLDGPIWMKSLIARGTLAVEKTIPFDRVVQADIVETESETGRERRTMCGGLPSWDEFYEMPEKRRPKSMKVTAQCRREFRKLEGG